MVSVTNLTIHPLKHYVDIGFIVELDEGEPKRMEPEKCTEIGWFDIDGLPELLFEFTEVCIEAYQKGRVYCDHTRTVANSD